MSISAKRRETEVFSLAFLDCICCGFGAVILVFILTITQKTTLDKESVAEVQARARRVESQVVMSQQDLDRLAKVLAARAAGARRPECEKQSGSAEAIRPADKNCCSCCSKRARLKDALGRLLGEKKALPTEDQAPLPIPNLDRSQYLTGFKLQGEYLVFLVRTSGSMLDDTIDTAAARLSDPRI